MTEKAKGYTANSKVIASRSRPKSYPPDYGAFEDHGEAGGRPDDEVKRVKRSNPSGTRNLKG